ncbi:hypothetical protein FISHEDRAFT_74863 [Fistulina hepatica ATCC 64428]|uniref:Protein kinase domain-containing protein n=1 Tax=Fistulina hepatica ATCC 64428 TaxID=1128425 RepID=A0A0D7ABB0_9AGAR|nr:hypothetical protein FISHEDRAFT_74863 [Fistulina hepatica ATCC 64428]
MDYGDSRIEGLWARLETLTPPPFPNSLSDWRSLSIPTTDRYLMDVHFHDVPWEALRDVFVGVGYTLYARRRYRTSPGAYILIPPEFVWSKLAVNEDGVYGSWQRLPEFDSYGLHELGGHSAFALPYDLRSCRNGRDVIVKLISDGIDPTGLRELEILQTLMSEPLKSHPDNQCVPVLEYIRHDKWVFAVFPRWSNCTEPNFESVGEVLDFYSCILPQEWNSAFGA